MYKRWSISDIEKVPHNGLKVFSFFSCGGGSTMGYKMAGYEVIGNCEIDSKIAKMYKENHHPRYSFNMDIRDFLRLKDAELPAELFGLDLLDGSPPCSSFSIAGNREKDWGKKKVFKEGQALQTLDDLFFEYIRAIDKLKPKVFVAENVKGMVMGKARGYMSEILRNLDQIGYTAQIFCLNSAKMGVPQRRERVFVIGHRKELDFPKLQLVFDEEPVLFGTIRSKTGKKVSKNVHNLLKHKKATDMKLSDINKRLYGKNTGFNHQLAWDRRVAPTITSNGSFMRANDDSNFSDQDFINCQSFPWDYNFCGMSVQYVCGMSVPPFMMRGIASEIASQWFLIP